MKIKTKKVYYCDFCKKHALRSLEKHELHCTMNPNRHCRMCGKTETLQPLIDGFKKQTGYESKESEYGGREIINVRQPKLEDILSETDNKFGSCPACTLAIIRLTGLHMWPYELNFDWEKIKKDWWDEKNSEPEEGYY